MNKVDNIIITVIIDVVLRIMSYLPQHTCKLKEKDRYEI